MVINHIVHVSIINHIGISALKSGMSSTLGTRRLSTGIKLVHTRYFHGMFILQPARQSKGDCEFHLGTRRLLIGIKLSLHRHPRVGTGNVHRRVERQVIGIRFVDEIARLLRLTAIGRERSKTVI